jgi:hypothetical protein
MVHHRKTRFHNLLLTSLLLMLGLATPVVVQGQAQRAPSDVVREFYKAMREHRFKEAWALTIYKSAVEGLSAEELEDLRPDFEQKAAAVPAQIEITGERIQGNIATVFVKVPVTDSTPQITSEPVNLMSSGNGWIIGTESDQAEVKKKGRRFFLDALIEEHENDIDDLFKRLLVVQLAYAGEHKGTLATLTDLITANLVAKESADPKAIGYTVRITITPDGKGYIATAEPTRYGHTGKLSFWMDQTGDLKKVDNGGKPLTGSK